MKLLFDHNLSYRLIDLLTDCYPGSVHVRQVNLQTALDGAVWDYALKHGLTIVSKNADFHRNGAAHHFFNLPLSDQRSLQQGGNSGLGRGSGVGVRAKLVALEKYPAHGRGILSTQFGGWCAAEGDLDWAWKLFDQ